MVQLRIFLLIVTLFLLSIFVSQTSAEACTKLSNRTCEECLKNVSCLWCIATKTCVKYPAKAIIPSNSLCPLNQARWGRCWVNFQALILTLLVFAGVVVTTIVVCCCCYCRKCKKKGTKTEEIKMELENEKRKARQEERKAEMMMRHDEIRQKYGLTKENPYTKFENN